MSNDPAAQPTTPASTPSRDPGLTTAAILLATFAGLVLVAFGVLRFPGVFASGYQIPVDRAFFTIINTATLAGFEQSWMDIGSFHLAGQITLAVLLLGGAWINMSVAAMAITRICRLGFSDHRLMISSAIVIAGFTVVGGAALGDISSGIISPLFAAGSAFTGSGLLMQEHWTLMSFRLHALLMPLAMVGGLGLPTLLELYDRLRRRQPITRYSKLVIIAVAAAYAVGMLLLLATMGRESGTWKVQVAKASVLSIATHGPGLPIVEIAELARPAQWIVIGLMLTGGVPASGAAGIGLPTLAILVLGLRRTLRDERPGRIFAIAAVWTITYLLLSGVVILLLLATEPQLPADRAILLAVSAAACVGLSHDAVSITGPGLYVLSIAMLVGRFAPLAALWWIAIRRSETDLTPISREI